MACQGCRAPCAQPLVGWWFCFWRSYFEVLYGKENIQVGSTEQDPCL